MAQVIRFPMHSSSLWAYIRDPRYVRDRWPPRRRRAGFCAMEVVLVPTIFILLIDSQSFSMLRLPEDLRLFRLLCPYMLVSLVAVKVLSPPIIRLTALIMLLPYADVAAEHLQDSFHLLVCTNFLDGLHVFEHDRSDIIHPG